MNEYIGRNHLKVRVTELGSHERKKNKKKRKKSLFRPRKKGRNQDPDDAIINQEKKIKFKALVCFSIYKFPTLGALLPGTF